MDEPDEAMGQRKKPFRSFLLIRDSYGGGYSHGNGVTILYSCFITSLESQRKSKK